MVALYVFIPLKIKLYAGTTLVFRDVYPVAVLCGVTLVVRKKKKKKLSIVQYGIRIDGRMHIR